MRSSTTIIALLWTAVLFAGCARSHERYRDAGLSGVGLSDGGRGALDASGAESGCPPVDDAMQAALDDFWSLSCDDPRVRELAALADETSIAAGPCVGSTPTLSPIVLVGIAPGTIRACAHVVSADPRSGIEVGADFRTWGPRFAVPYDAVDVEISIVGPAGPPRV